MAQMQSWHLRRSDMNVRVGCLQFGGRGGESSFQSAATFSAPAAADDDSWD